MADELARSFGAAAGSYEAGRPEYPFEAVAWMLEPMADGARRVADVGAGTGKLTRALVAAADAEVVAIDPDPAMLAALREAVPGVPTFVGTAEELPLPDASVDAVVLGQAWHWVEPVAASAEIGRAVRPGGVLGLVWNLRDERVDWVRRLTDIMHGSNAEIMLAAGDPVVAEPFGSLAQERWEWSRPMTRELLHRMAASRSAVITADEAEKDRIRREMDALFDELGLHGHDTVEVPYVTRAFRATRG
ncbi:MULTISPECIES: class I SAM-dependent methyltransferase [unclassified Microbacterium]|uniref:class I SAM-dependent methyltransferase n=1 Tax=unclassified Microbacterium TaxID=2609290 RepID=UPI00246826E6|nr:MULTISPECIES: class I SAM-dependent methyltransferase [unclassified Microbacterium]MDH5134144.1 class I SAM-dependent methyltransferase [Microbacterium sp. RD10]MDH5137727.1 class I SAM-dependent methyltransferase [Microbacterium sp. RD11]MDH5145273.1 class I SAM-dependent methyltransferase [Microbacterium sp. RD12]MDH5155872.1 class I SAM-dependent methyltransferase [Microbacterium sp. RD06]MDH5166126.1 class I SAM-dependent methyltransferase [Microbacterium sp. RD02]